MLFDVAKARSETPGCDHVLHFNNAGAGLMPQVVLDAQLDYLQLEATIGGYESAAARTDQIQATYDAAAELINAQRDEIALVENATVAWQLAFTSIPFQAGDRILTAQASYVSNYINFLLAAERYGVIIDVIPNDDHDQVSADALADMMDERVKLIAITHAPTNGGLVNPAESIGKVAQKWDALYLLDACQSIGQLPVDVVAIVCDILSTTGRKWLRGPRGTGFLYVSNQCIDKLNPPVLDLHSAKWVERNRYKIQPGARRFENWEYNYAGVVGLGASLTYAKEWGMEPIWSRVQMLGKTLHDKLKAIPGISVHDVGEVRGGTVTFSLKTPTGENVDVEKIHQALSAHKINTSTSTVFSTRLDAEARQLPDIVRASVHYYNTEDEIEQFCTVLQHTIPALVA
ncbi:MAG: aminotransferase class V-fold PLP-dependent enzyme [Chloroflexota bacterium]